MRQQSGPLDIIKRVMKEAGLTQINKFDSEVDLFDQPTESVRERKRCYCPAHGVAG